MALSVSRAAALIVFGCTLAAAAWLPPQPTPIQAVRTDEAAGRPDAVRRLRREITRTGRELSVAGETLRFLQRRDSLAAALDGAAGLLMGVATPEVPEPWVAWLSEHTDRVTPATGGRTAGGTVLAAVFVDTVAWRRQSREWRRFETWFNSTVTAFGPAATPFTCLAIHDLRRGTRQAGHRVLVEPRYSPSRNALGICRFFAAYGAPGPGVRAWLLAGGWQYGTTDGAGRHGLFEAARRRYTYFPSLVSEGRYALGACVEGATRGCRAWFLLDAESRGPDWRGVTPLPWGGAARLEEHSGFVTAWWGEGDEFGGLLADLDDEMGPERFRAFWTSPSPVGSAFGSAFGVDVGIWTRDWLERRYGPLPRRGPRAGDFAATVVIAGLLVAFGAARGYGRKA
jgi:hypothetical protein